MSKYLFFPILIAIVVFMPIAGHLTEASSEANSEDYDFVAIIIKFDHNQEIKKQAAEALSDGKLSISEVASIRSAIRKEKLRYLQAEKEENFKESKKKALELVER